MAPASLAGSFMSSFVRTASPSSLTRAPEASRALDDGVAFGSDELGDGVILAGILVGGGQRAVAYVQHADDDESRHGDDDDRVDEHADHGDDTLVMRVFDVSERVGMRRGAHAGFVREQAALGALRDGCPDAEEGAAQTGGRVEGALEDEGKGIGEVAGVHDEHDDGTADVEDGHDGHELLGDGCEAVQVADEDETGEHSDDEADQPGRNAECVVHGLTDGVGLDHGADDAERDDGSNREEHSEELAAAALEGGGDVVSRAAVGLAFLVDDLRLLRENGLGVVRRHAEQRDDPHPEDRARAADEDRTACADDVAGADLRGNGRCERLERAHGAAAVTARERKLSEHLLPALAEAAELHAARADGEEQARADEQNQQDIV